MVHSEKQSSSVRLRGAREEHDNTGSSRARQVPNHDGLVSCESCSGGLPVCHQHRFVGFVWLLVCGFSFIFRTTTITKFNNLNIKQLKSMF